MHTHRGGTRSRLPECQALPIPLEDRSQNPEVQISQDVKKRGSGLNPRGGHTSAWSSLLPFASRWLTCGSGVPGSLPRQPARALFAQHRTHRGGSPVLWRGLAGMPDRPAYLLPQEACMRPRSTSVPSRGPLASGSRHGAGLRGQVEPASRPVPAAAGCFRLFLGHGEISIWPRF